MSPDPTFSPRCTCPWVDGLRHYDPTCYEHGEWPELEAPKVAELEAEVEGLHLRGSYDLCAAETERDAAQAALAKVTDPDEKWYCGRGPCGRMGDHEGDCA